MISRPPGRASRPVARTRATSGSAATGSTVSGCSPVSPSTTAFTLPWPCPVAPSEPNSSTRSPATRGIRPSAASASVNMPAARIGPTVCELDGPIPILNSSNALIAMARLLSAAPRRCVPRFAPRAVGGALVAVPRTRSPDGSNGGRSDIVTAWISPPTFTWYEPVRTNSGVTGSPAGSLR